MLAVVGGRTHRTAVPHEQELGGRVVEEGCSLLANPMCVRRLLNKPLAFYTPSHCMLLKMFLKVHNPNSLKDSVSFLVTSLIV